MMMDQVGAIFSSIERLLLLMTELERSKHSAKELDEMQVTAIKEAKEMTPREFRDWRKTIIGARAWCIQSHYDPQKCGPELEIVLADARDRNQKEWDKHFKRAKDYVSDKNLSEKEAHETAVMLAENRTVERGYVPPHWAGWSDCRQCGIVPTSTGAGEKAIACPWCLTEFFKED